MVGGRFAFSVRPLFILGGSKQLTDGLTTPGRNPDLHSNWVKQTSAFLFSATNLRKGFPLDWLLEQKATGYVSVCVMVAARRLKDNIDPNL